MFREVSAGISWYGHAWGTIRWYWKVGIEKVSESKIQGVLAAIGSII